MGRLLWGRLLRLSRVAQRDAGVDQRHAHAGEAGQAVVGADAVVEGVGVPAEGRCGGVPAGPLTIALRRSRQRGVALPCGVQCAQQRLAVAKQVAALLDPGRREAVGAEDLVGHAVVGVGEGVDTEVLGLGGHGANQPLRTDSNSVSMARTSGWAKCSRAGARRSMRWSARVALASMGWRAPLR